MNKVMFYYCPICGNIIEKIQDSGRIPRCCGEHMIILEPGLTDGAAESHVPTWSREKHCVRVQIGEKPHPMEAAHYIQWVVMVTSDGIYRKHLKPGDPPVVYFIMDDEEVVLEIYEYCNKHALWKKER